ncbi:MAG: helix-hairpin-helix domain-containing protein [Candidatus Woesearchaeota archaeon]
MSKVDYVVGVRQPTVLRKNLLESAKYTITVLQQKKRLGELRTQRKDKLAQLKTSVGRMNDSLVQLQKQLPERKQAPKLTQKVVTKQPEPEKPKPVERPQSDSELTKIKGLGPARVQKLAQQEIHSVKDLAGASVKTVTKAGIPQATAKKLIAQAKQELTQPSSNKPKALSELDLLEQKLSEIESKLNNL